MRRTSVAAAAAALLMLATATGCGEEAEEGPLDVGGDASASDGPTADATESEAPDRGPRFDNKGHESVRGSSDVSTPEEEAVADAWFGYWQLRAKSFGEATVDPELGTVAAADAVSDVVRYVAYLKSKGLKTVGDTRIDVSDVQVQGTSATLSSCAENKSIDRYDDGTPAEEPIPFFTSEGTLVKRAGAWRVVAAPVTTSSARC